ncbi:MAG: LD-carboxypeptidase, partial [Gemmatimonadota bacterium]|nr:LD-carboxypeptidase [Gemmatimonadota bacterium]
AMARQGYLAGPDADRVEDLNRAFRDSRVDGVWCLRGGYGTMRILDAIDYDALRAHPKAIIGYSDITALHLAVAARCDLCSFHGPTARAILTDFSRASLARAAGATGGEPCGVAPHARVLRDGVARGPIVGGNLALLTALVGTPYAARCDGAILIVEDVNEPAYRIDRMLRHLRLAGILAKCSGLLFGDFTLRADSDDDPSLLDDVLREAADTVNGPCLAGVPVGHIDDQWTLPLGSIATLDTRARSLHTRAQLLTSAI